ncbi:MAG TPA: PKD domain-containing protein [Thermoanaerobaculia bacterium]|nr:PKD domain-containing protein [Thermoanaerobaculia bacterium]
MRSIAKKPSTGAWLRSGGAWLLLVIGTSFLATAAHAGEGVWTSGGPYVEYLMALAIDPSAPATLYAGTWGAGVFKSTNGGGSWTAINAGLTYPHVGALAIDPSAPATLYASNFHVYGGANAGVDGAGVFKSTNGGESWTAINAGLTNLNVFALAIDSSAPATLYAGTWGGGVLKSTNGGESWTAINAGLTDRHVSALAIDPSAPATIYAGMGYTGRVYKSTNGGGTWTSTSDYPNRDVDALAIDPSASSTLYAGLGTSEFSFPPMGIIKSTDGGANWTESRADLFVLALAIDPSTPATLYAGTRGDGVFKSTDAGGSWTAVNAGLSNLTINALALDHTGGTTLYAGTDYGVWQLTAPTGGITASFSFTPASPSAGQTIQFTDTSTGSPTSWKWDFGDGFGSAAQNPTHAFATAGAFPVTLTASSSAGSNTTTKTVSVTSAAASSCFEDASTMCLAGGRYRVSSHWRNQYAGGSVSTLSTDKLTDATGAFWLSNADTYEFLIRINTATDNGRAWFAISTFTDVEFWIDVTDTVNGQSKEYHSAPGNKTLIYDPYFFVYP